MRTPGKGQYGDGREATFGTEEWETGAGGQETGGPTPAGLLPCHLLPLKSIRAALADRCTQSHTTSVTDVVVICWLLVDHQRSCRDRQRTITSTNNQRPSMSRARPSLDAGERAFCALL